MSEKFKARQSHEQFQKFLTSTINHYFDYHKFKSKIVEQADIIYKVFITDLTSVREVLIDTYNPRGEKPWDPVSLFRTYWLMCQYGENGSITKWIKKLKSNPFWAIVSGFHPANIPGVGTLYDFEDRLCDFDNGDRAKRTKKMLSSDSKPQKKFKKNQKKPPKSKGIVERLIERIIRDEDTSQPQRDDDLLHTIFKQSFVIPSAQKGLLGNPTDLQFAGDGMVLSTGSSPYGIKECDCWEKQGKLNCDCPRRFNDPDANWGWDSYREIYIYGYSNYTFTAADSPHDLPLFSTIAQASRHDSVSHTYALYRMKELYPEFNFSADILDSAHDNYATYEFLDHLNIEPFIALNPKNKGNFKYEPPIDITDEGVPICKAGFEMVNWGIQKKRRRIKWRCPHVVLKGCTCPEFNCSDSDYGRTCYTKPDWDKRIFTPTPRGSQKWNKTMKKRTSSERRNSQVKIKLNLEQDKVRSKSRWLIRIIMRDSAIHANAWVENANINPKEWVKQWFIPQTKIA